MTTEQRALVVRELREDPERVGYAGKTWQQGYALLHEPRMSRTETVTGARFNAGLVLKTLGVTRGRAFLNAVSAAMPGISLPYFGAPVTLSPTDLAAFRAALNGYPGIDPAELAAVEAAAEPVKSVATELTWARIGRAFVGVPGMPNAIDAVEFAAAWQEAGYGN